VGANDLKSLDCPFCDIDRKIVAQNSGAIAIRDMYPVSSGHTLVVPRQHANQLTELDSIVYTDCFSLVRTVMADLQRTHNPDGINIGVNCGESAGQTINHVHIHVIPRYKGDVPNPQGGIRGVIPGKADY